MAKRRKVTNLTEDMAKWLEAEAKKTGISESAILSTALRQMKINLERV